MVPGLFLNILTNILISECDSLGFSPDRGNVVTHQKYLK